MLGIVTSGPPYMTPGRMSNSECVFVDVSDSDQWPSRARVAVAVDGGADITAVVAAATGAGGVGNLEAANAIMTMVPSPSPEEEGDWTSEAESTPEGIRHARGPWSSTEAETEDTPTDSTDADAPVTILPTPAEEASGAYVPWWRKRRYEQGDGIWRDADYGSPQGRVGPPTSALVRQFGEWWEDFNGYWWLHDDHGRWWWQDEYGAGNRAT